MRRRYSIGHGPEIRKEMEEWLVGRGLVFNTDWGWSLFGGIWIQNEEDATALKLKFSVLYV